ncbi:MAG: hypothetical protein M4579_006547 [Chaenotheca gracillima]|nr:MAG: hypothetical protein M4579_006547 [Chaenotheca gracillima]
MNLSDSRGRQRNQINGAPQGGRLSNDGEGRVNTASSASPAGNMSRAERFEDEKRRIIETCFAKKDDKGSVVESYITHIRITEDGQHPSAPPPSDSAPENKKFRVIIVSVRSSGRVRMHKARENPNGSFSIGKTWALDDLSAIQSFAGVPATTREEETLNQRAGKAGFVVTIQKPYYWLAGTAKEKEFFIGSLVKIFKKYTGGRVPELIGFDSKDTEMLAGAPGQSVSRPSTGNREETPSAQPSRSPGPPPLSQQRVAPSPGPPSQQRGSPAPSAAPQQRRRSPAPVPTPSMPPPQVRNSPTPIPPQQNRSSPAPIPPLQARSSPAPLPPPQTRNSPAPPPPLLQPESSPIPEPAPLSPRRHRSPSEEMQNRTSQEQFRRPRDPDPRPATPEARPFTPQDRNGKSPVKSPPTVVTDEPTPVSPPEPPPEPREEVHRPGLGPMIKKKSNRDVATAFRKAATAYNAFKPRAGGAGDRLLEGKERPSNEPDGITGVVPAPSLLRGKSEDSKRAATPDQNSERTTPPALSLSPEKPRDVPEVKITAAPPIPAPEIDQRRPSTTRDQAREASPEKALSKSPKAQEAKKAKRRSDQTTKYVTALGIDVRLLDGRTADFESLLDEFGWGNDTKQERKLETLEAEVRRELGRVEAGSWLGHLEQKDERVEAVEKMLDKAIAECDELDGLLTLYGVELSTLNDDIAYIEAQSQGLQVQTANQKLLHAELQTLLQTISISSADLQSLKSAHLDTPAGLESAEMSLSMLYKAMVTIDPSMRGNSLSDPRASEDGQLSTSSGGNANNEIGNMQALQEKKLGYRGESINFLGRLEGFLGVTFKAAAQGLSKGSEQLSRTSGVAKLDPRIHDPLRNQLWQFTPLMFFAREVEPTSWTTFMKLYEEPMKELYQNQIRDNLATWKRLARKPTGEEQELLFTAQEKDESIASTTARKLTVKRSQTLAKSLRSEKGDSGSRHVSAKSQDGKMHPFEAVIGALDVLTPIMFVEQNFVVEFFHVSSVQHMDFPDFVKSVPLQARRGGDLTRPLLLDNDRNMSKRVWAMMESIYYFWPAELQSLVDWAIKADPLQGVGVLLVLERKIADVQDTNQEFLTKTFQKVHNRLATQFSHFLNEQIHAIEETKVKIKKRKGVIAFMKTFPHFSSAVENLLPNVQAEEDLEIRQLVNDAYVRINKAMFESLRAIAKESPAVMTAGQGIHGQTISNDPEDKEALNYHILLIENMNHYLEEVDSRDNIVLQDWWGKAAAEMSEHMDLYLSAVIRRPLGKILDFLESTESLLTTIPNPADIGARASHSRSVVRKLLASHDTRELRRSADTLRKRVEKHFGDADDPSLSRGLVAKVLKECASRYEDIGRRVRTVLETVYVSDGSGPVEWDWKPEEVVAVLRR